MRARRPASTGAPHPKTEKRLARQATIEQRLASLRALDATQPTAIAPLRDALRSPTGIVVAAAAKLAGEHRHEALVPDLIEAFEQLASEPRVKQDPGCRGKNAIARALHELDHWDDRVFAVGLRIVQREGYNPGGPADDTAAELRGICGLAYAHFARREALDVLAELLVDGERVTRLAAAQGLGDAGRPDASALLRYKILSGDDEADVVGACFESLLDLGREAATPFVIGQLARGGVAAEAAALALGQARIATALDALVEWTDRSRPDQRRIGYLAIALLRGDAGNGYLATRIREGNRNDAIAAARALATFKDQPGIAERIRGAARGHPDRAVRAEVDKLLA